MISPFEVDTGTQTFSNLEGKTPPKKKKETKTGTKNKKKKEGKKTKKGKKAKKGKKNKKGKAKEQDEDGEQDPKELRRNVVKKAKKAGFSPCNSNLVFSRSTGFTISLRPFRI